MRFKSWLTRQRHRADNIGALAQNTIRLRAAPFSDLIRDWEHFFLKVGADEETLEALQDAFSEWERHVPRRSH